MRLLFLLFALLIAGCAPGRNALEGRWAGRVTDPDGETDLILDFSARTGRWRGTLSLPGRRLLGKPVGDIEWNPPNLAFTLPARVGRLRFQGRLDGDMIEGSVASVAGAPPVRLRRIAASPPPYHEEAVDFASGRVQLHGSLLLPPGRGPWPAVILVHGSSTPDRNDFRYFADLYARRGVAAFIYDKRPTGGDANGGTASLETLAEDVVAAAVALTRRSDIDVRRIGLWGFSQGGWVAPIAASRHRFAFVAVLSAPGVSYAEVNMFADAARLRRWHYSEATIAEAMRVQRELDAFVRAGGDEARIQAMLDSARRERWARLSTLPARIPDANQRRRYLRWIDLDFDPARYWAQVNAPVFIAYGTSDENVPVELSARKISDALRDAGNRQVTVRRYDGANHSLAPAPTLEADLLAWTWVALALPSLNSPNAPPSRRR
jgi:dienelactone hydrolase